MTMTWGSSQPFSIVHLTFFPLPTWNSASFDVIAHGLPLNLTVVSLSPAFKMPPTREHPNVTSAATMAIPAPIVLLPAMLTPYRADAETASYDAHPLSDLSSSAWRISSVFLPCLMACAIQSHPPLGSPAS